MAVVLRFMVTINSKSNQIDQDFDLKIYFDIKHIIRWGLHLCSSVVALFTLPDVMIKYVFPKYIPEVEAWSLLGSAILGFMGYDLVKYAEKAISKVSKIGK